MDRALVSHRSTLTEEKSLRVQTQLINTWIGFRISVCFCLYHLWIEHGRTVGVVACRHWFGSFDGLWHWPLMEVFTFTDEPL